MGIPLIHRLCTPGEPRRHSLRQPLENYVGDSTAIIFERNGRACSLQAEDAVGEPEMEMGLLIPVTMLEPQGIQSQGAALDSQRQQEGNC